MSREYPWRTTCQACGANEMQVFYEVQRTPTQSCILLDDADAARAYPLGEVSLAVCRVCGFIQNTLFDPSLVDYSVPTEESQAYSPRFRSFSNELIDDLVERHRPATALEVGCGKGDFLIDLAERGIETATGIDPGFLPDRVPAGDAQVTFIRDWFDERYTHLTGDVVIARHLLEHVPDVRNFTRLLVESVSRTEDSFLFIELPDVRRVLEEGAFWDVYYEHCSYFTLGSLGRMLRSLGLDVTRLGLGFGDQYLLAEAAPAMEAGPHPAEEDVSKILAAVESFSMEAERLTEGWRSRLWGLLDRGGRAAIWGGGSKAVAFLASLDGIPLTVVDINPHKQGKYLPGSGVMVQSPSALTTDPPDVVVVMNPIYRDEITAQLDALGVAADVSTVEAPEQAGAPRTG
jgi:SAM-dependent methyltransferase